MARHRISLFGAVLSGVLAGAGASSPLFAHATPSPVGDDAIIVAPAAMETADKLIDNALEDDTAYEIVKSLTTEIGPRLAGSPGEARARDWGVAKLKALGFKNVRIEPFDIPYWARGKERVEIVSPFPQPLVATALGGSVATPEGGVEGPVVRFDTLSALASAPPASLEGKIVFVDEGMARTQDGSGYGTAVAKRSGAAIEAGKRGAIAAIIRSVGTDLTRRNPHTGAMSYRDAARKIPAVAISNPDADQLARALDTSKAPVVVRLDVSVETKAAAPSGNVIGEIPGKTDEIIVIGGHLDSWDLGTGAVDDGAGVAITMAAAKLVGDLPGRPRRTIRVVLWGAEETGLHGARAYAMTHAEELDRHILASESDFGAGAVWQFRTGFGARALDKAKPFQAALRRLNIGPGDNKAGGGPDIIPLRQAGVPTFRLRQSGWDYFDLHHTPDDTLDKIDAEDLRQNVAAWAATLYLASEIRGGFRDIEDSAVSP